MSVVLRLRFSTCLFTMQGPRTGRRAASTLVPVANDVEDDLSSAAPHAPLGLKPQVGRVDH